MMRRRADFAAAVMVVMEPTTLTSALPTLQAHLYPEFQPSTQSCLYHGSRPLTSSGTPDFNLYHLGPRRLRGGVAVC
jgi:hypothetical protein